MAQEDRIATRALELDGAETANADWAAQLAAGPTARALELAVPDCAPEESGDELAETETVAEIALKNGVYHEVRRKLNQRFGIPLHEVAFIHDADTPAKKAALFEAVNAGRVRILLGSTGKLGTGVNVQKRLVALHHVDQPWKPAELEQREGRILRQGNIYPEVFVFHYVTERSFDGYMLQTLEAKARFISQIMAGEVTARTAEDVGEMVLTVAQVKAIASGNPAVQRRIETEVKLVKLDRLRAAFYQQRAALRTDLEELPERSAAQGAVIAGHERALQKRQPLAADAFQMTLKEGLGAMAHRVWDKRERAGAQLRRLADLLTEQLQRSGRGGSVTEEVGAYRGFRVAVHVAGHGRFAGLSSLFDFRAEVHLRAEAGGVCYVAQMGESNVGVTQSIDYQLRHLEEQLEQARSKLLTLETRLVKAREEVNRPWGPAGAYNRLRREYEALGETLQAAGVALESNTVFVEETGVEEEPVAAETEDQAAPDTAASLADTGITRNPFTGLEDWPLVAAEGAVEMAEAAPAQIAQTQIGLWPCNTATDESDAPGDPTSGAISVPSLNLRPILDRQEAGLPLLAQANLPLAGLTETVTRPPKKPHPRRNANNGPARKQNGWLWQD
jgi:hypothetical protein